MTDEEDPDQTGRLERTVSSAQDIVDQLRDGWKKAGLPPEILAHAMIGSGVTDLTNERGVNSALDVLRRLVDEIEQSARGRPN